MSGERVSEAPPRWSRLLTVANVLVSQLNTLLVTAGAFVITPAVLNGLGDSAYGGWLLMNAFISYLRLLDQGTPAGAMKYGAAALASGDKVELARIFDTTAAAFAVVGVLAGFMSLAFSFLLPHAYASILSGQGATIALLGGAMAVDLMFRTYGAALRTRSLFLVYDGIELITYVIFKLGLVLYFRHTLSYRVLAYITLAETITRNILVISSTLVFCPWVRRLRPMRADKDTFRRIAILGIAVSIIQVADVVRFQLDSSVIGYFIPNAATLIAIFGVGARVPSISYYAIAVIGSVMMPRFAVLWAQKDFTGMKDLLRKSSLATGLASTYLLVNAAVFGPHFLNLWLKKPWTPESGTILLMMLPAYYIMLFGSPTVGLLLSSGRLRGLTIITVVEAAANFVLSVALVKPFGIYGVAAGTVIPMIFMRGIALPIIIGKTIDISPGAWWKMHVRALCICGVYLALILRFAWLPLPSYQRFVLYGLASTAIYGVLLVIAIPEARAWVMGRLRRLRSGD
jgi:O-antigen/teichoic acid export membrane protein